MNMKLAKPEAARAIDHPVIQMPAETEPLPASVKVSVHLCALVLVTAALYLARDFFLPVVLAFLFALTLIPIVRGLARRGVPSGLSAAALVLMLAFGLGAAGYFLSGPVATWIDQAPNMGRQIESKLRSLRGSVEAVAKATKQVDDLSKTTADPSVQEVVIKEKGFLSSATSTL
jgi:predicted PurR-regulated permease PerM